MSCSLCTVEGSGWTTPAALSEPYTRAAPELRARDYGKATRRRPAGVIPALRCFDFVDVLTKIPYVPEKSGTAIHEGEQVIEPQFKEP